MRPHPKDRRRVKALIRWQHTHNGGVLLFRGMAYGQVMFTWDWAVPRG